MIGYAMGTRGYRIWDPISNDVYESKHIKFDESKLYKDVVSTYHNDAPLHILDGNDTVYTPTVESSDESDDEISSQSQPLTPVLPAPKRPARSSLHLVINWKPSLNLFLWDHILLAAFEIKYSPTFLCQGRWLMFCSMLPQRGFHRTAVPNKPGWEREEVQRQSGATKGQWDIYFYAPGRRFPLRSRPEIREYCEKTLNVPYNPDEFSWKPTEAPIDTVSPVDTDNEGETQTMTPENDNVDSDPECYTSALYNLCFYKLGSSLHLVINWKPSLNLFLWDHILVKFVILSLSKLFIALWAFYLAAFEIKYSPTFLCQGKMADVFAPCYLK
uniref:MBD domain-containing protein n=1 Tax=Strigamia maritima TaxID=126957 RepID=T1J2C9_STRMM